MSEKHMKKTRVDDMLIEMITPKVRDIEEKFGKGEGLTQEDINTLLLKSQYNHINHLDQKLDEVVADVSSLKTSFSLLEQKVEQRFETFEQRFETFEQRFETFENKIEASIQKALNKNFMMVVGAVSAVLLISKFMDKFFQ